MLDKTAGAVGCAHCKQLGADPVCPICDRPICKACDALDNCPRPHRREVRLGIGRRLRAIDPSGAAGVVSTLSRAVQLWDLEAGSRQAKLQRSSILCPWPCLVTRDLVLRTHIATMTNIPSITVGAPGNEEERVLSLSTQDLPFTSNMRESLSIIRQVVTEDGSVALVARSDLVLDVVKLEDMTLAGTLTFPGMIQSVAASSTLGLAAVGLYGKVNLFRIRDLESVDPVVLGSRHGDVAWVGLGGGRLAAVTEQGWCLVVEVDRQRPTKSWRRILELQLEDRSGRLANPLGESAKGKRRVCAAISLDGRLLAVRQKLREVHLFRLPSPEPAVLTGHTDRISFMQFTTRGRLVTADNDGRVFSWPPLVSPDES